MKKIVLILALLLAGCNDNVPVAVKFPNVPAELLEACPALKQIDTKTTKLSDVIEVVSDNYMQYHTCREKINDWIVWYNTQKQIFDDVK
jgi:broad-specificity NMP kinase